MGGLFVFDANFGEEVLAGLFCGENFVFLLVEEEVRVSFDFLAEGDVFV